MALADGCLLAQRLVTCRWPSMGEDHHTEYPEDSYGPFGLLSGLQLATSEQISPCSLMYTSCPPSHPLLPPPSLTLQEIVDKAPLLPKDIRWHFVGHLQRNKVRSLLGAVPNLEVVESVDGEKLADKLSAFVLEEGATALGWSQEGWVGGLTWSGACAGNAAIPWPVTSQHRLHPQPKRKELAALRAPVLAHREPASPIHSPHACAEREPLGVMVQVNTSGEVSKFGVSPGESCIGLARHIHQQCPGLKLVGLMTIGMAGVQGGGGEGGT